MPSWYGGTLPVSSVWRVKPRLTCSIVLFLISVSISGYSLVHNRQLGLMDGMAEEYFRLGSNLSRSGSFHADGEPPVIMRPPGYAFFIATVLEIWGGFPDDFSVFRTKAEFDRVKERAFRAVYVAQSLLLGASTVLLFLWMAMSVRLRHAFLLALLFGSSPYTIILTGFLHYSTLHMFLLIASGYALSVAMNSNPLSMTKMTGAGLLWGVTTLVRPVTLILPAFVLIMLVLKFRPSLQLVLKGAGGLIIGMMLMIAPYTARNFSQTDRFVAVNAQSGISVWAGTVKKTGRDANHYRWWHRWYIDGMPIFQQITGQRDYSFSVYAANIFELEEAFRKAAVENIRRQPAIYLYNVTQNSLSLAIDINSVFIKMFQVIQTPHMIINKNWLLVGDPQTFYSSSTERLFRYFIGLLTVVGFLGLGAALIRRDPSLIVPGLVYVCLVTAHSITYMDVMYYYLKIPFLFIFYGYGVQALERYQMSVPWIEKRLSASSFLHAVMVIFGLGLTFNVLVLS